MLFKATIGLSFQRMFLTGLVTFPFSIKYKPSRVSPVTQDRLRIERPDVPEPGHQDATLGSCDEFAIVAAPPSMIMLAGPAVGFFPSSAPRTASRKGPS